MIVQLKFILLFFFLVVTDQLTKNLAKSYLINQGISFGLSQGISKWLILIFLLVIFLLLIADWSKKTVTAKLILVFFISGAVSNLIDRFFFSGVRDWLYLPFMNFSNNLADIWISVGFLGIIYVELKNLIKQKTKQSLK